MATKKKPAPADEKRESYQTTLKVELTTAEVADRADRAAAKLAERDQKEAEWKAQSKHMKSVIEELEAELRTLSGEVRTRSTYSPVSCERVFNYDAGTLREQRLDTGEVLCERGLTDAEKQRELPFEGNGDGDE
jgi:hypothetical protein